MFVFLFADAHVSTKVEWDQRKEIKGSNTMMVLGTHDGIVFNGETVRFVIFTSPAILENAPPAIANFGGIVPVCSRASDCGLVYTYILRKS